jgi:membrane protease YdiL (CAAX protease family)
MNQDTRHQLNILFLLIISNVILAVLYYILLPAEMLEYPTAGQPTLDLPRWALGLANGGIILVIYCLAGLAGYWFSRQLGLPGTFRPDAGWRSWFIWPLVAGVIMGIVIVLVDRAFSPPIQAALNTSQNWQGLTHPPFPLSIIASATAGIGEEILFRSFVLGLWAFLLNLLLRRWQATRLALWIGNFIAALAFAASHLPSAILLLGASTPAELPTALLAELLLLNGVLGLVAGERYFQDGLVAAIGVHFWADIIWHVLYPLV